MHLSDDTHYTWSDDTHYTLSDDTHYTLSDDTHYTLSQLAPICTCLMIHITHGAEEMHHMENT